ncbi:hypothetical protein LP420_17805 [Massilia sp. B-10]|nr:hypothetical protein LP420_17805 [Massilia sp. B-10]
MIRLASPAAPAGVPSVFMTEKNHTFPNAFEGIMLAVALMLAEYLIGALLFDMKVLSAMNALDADGHGDDHQ